MASVKGCLEIEPIVGACIRIKGDNEGSNSKLDLRSFAFHFA
jgi:hypothetical protein